MMADSSIGLKRGIVRLADHQAVWADYAAETIRLLREILGDAADDIQHVGSTSIPGIKAKPIIDIAVATMDYERVLSWCEELSAQGVHLRFDERPGQLLFVMGDFVEDTRTHHIHVVQTGSKEWRGYLAFRDYLRANPDMAKEYEQTKMTLAERYPSSREAYTEGKAAFITGVLRVAGITDA